MSATARSLVCLTALLLGSAVARADVLVIEDFDDVSDWSGLAPESTLVQDGSGAGRWADTVGTTSVRRTFATPLDLSGYDHVGLWIYSAQADGARLQFVFDSEDDSSPGWDYYSTELVIDWSGWRWVWIPITDLAPSRAPVGWDTIRAVSLSASGWGHTPLPTTNLVLDNLVAANAVVVRVIRHQGWQGSDFVYTFDLELAEPDGAPLSVDVGAAAPSSLDVGVQPAHLDLAPFGTASAQVTVTVPAAEIAAGPYRAWDVTFSVTTAGGGHEGWTEAVVSPPSPAGPPRMLLTRADFDRIATWVQHHPWAASRQQSILDRADDWPAGYLARYGLSSVALPPEGGQWSMHYVCPVHGVDLVYEPPMTHRCPVDGATYSGWPYDQVIYGRQHNDLARAARDLGLAWQFTGQSAYAQAARDLLVAYAGAYEAYPVHGVDGSPSGSGGRVLAQTLDESGWLVQIAWAYDLIADSPALSAADHDAIAQHLLRPAAALIARHDAGASNWQAWHNAAVAAAGQALGDPRLLAWAVDGPSGFRFQMAESVLADGFWYEGSWGYHFFALSPLTYLAEMAERAELPLFDDPALRSLYTAPVRFAPPDLVLPAFNDARAVDLRGSAGWRLEAAYEAFGDPLLLVPLQGEQRPEEALFWGAETLPSSAPAVTESLVFPASGYGILRGGTAEDPWWAALDFGPHGGWHGHFDKLNLVLFARGRMLGLDPGSHSYALPLHDTWDRATVAHNTVVVDESVQQETTGSLERFEALPGLAWVRAGGGDAAPGVAMTRDVVLAPGYVVDRFTATATDGQDHRFDWLWHAEGALEPAELTLAPYGGLPASGGYEHLANPEGAAADTDVRFRFAWDSDTHYPGGYWSNDSQVVASQSYDETQSHGGAASGRLEYDFTQAAADAYITFRTRSMAGVVTEVPTRLSVWVRGDGSGHSFRLRIVDATGESHVSATAPLDFVGWQQVSYDVAGFSHWSGNDDGVIDLPVSSLVFQLNREAGGPPAGSVHLDDWEVTLPSAGVVLAEDYERPAARTRLWIHGAAGSTYVRAAGIGPDLAQPVPCLLVRRQGPRALFDVVHEPHGRDAPALTDLAVLPPDGLPPEAAVAYRLERAAAARPATDHLVLVGAGAAGTPRTYGGSAGVQSDALLAFARTEPPSGPQAHLTVLALAQGTSLTVAGVDLFRAAAPLAQVAFEIAPPAITVTVADGQLADGRLLAPGTETVTYAGQPVPFRMEGDYVVFGQLPALPDAGVPDGGAGADGGVGEDAGPTPGSERAGCGCGAAHGPGSVPLPGLLLLLGLALGAITRGLRASD